MNENDFNQEIAFIGEMAIRRMYQNAKWKLAPKKELQLRLESIGLVFSLSGMQDYIDDIFWLEDASTGDIQVEFTQTKTTCSRCPQGHHFRFMMSEFQKDKYIHFNSMIMEHINSPESLFPLLPPQTKCVFNLVSQQGIFSFDFGELVNVKIKDGVATLTDFNSTKKIGSAVDRYAINVPDKTSLFEACKSRSSWKKQRQQEEHGQGRWW